MKSFILNYVRRIFGTSHLNARLDGMEAQLRDLHDLITSSLASPEAIRRETELRETVARVSDTMPQIRDRIAQLEQRAQADTQRLAQKISLVDGKLDQLTIDTADGLGDVIELVLRDAPPGRKLHADVIRPVALDSPDHYEPRGTKNDNTRHPRFVHRCESLLPSIVHLDIGCAGGGLVWDFTLRGHLSVGIEGSDYSLREQRAEWRIIPNRLFTADISAPFRVLDEEDKPVLFNLVTAWELFEHIPTESVDPVLDNIIANMTPDAMLVCSVATFVDKDDTTGTVYHQTVESREWWLDKFRAKRLEEQVGLFETADFVRGSGNPRADDWDVRKNPEMGFHLALKRTGRANAE